MSTALNSQLEDCRYPCQSEAQRPNIFELRTQGKISNPEQLFFFYLKKQIKASLVQQYPVPAFDRVTYNKFFWHMDIYIPRYQLAIEINGCQHYNNTRQFVNDHWKQLDCNRLGITVVSFPCFPPSQNHAYLDWCDKMFSFWSKDIKALIKVLPLD